MRQYAIKRIGLFIPTVLLVTVIVFVVMRLVPGDPALAIKPDSLLDYGARSFTLMGIAIPQFFAAIILILFLVKTFGWLPPLGYVRLWDDPLTNLQQG